MDSLKEAIQKFIDKNQIMILFLVDELDRCRPDYAISYLETIKHIFDIQGTVFILAADKRHLEILPRQLLELSSISMNTIVSLYIEKFLSRRFQILVTRKSPLNM